MNTVDYKYIRIHSNEKRWALPGETYTVRIKLSEEGDPISSIDSIYKDGKQLMRAVHHVNRTNLEDHISFIKQHYSEDITEEEWQEEYIKVMDDL